MGPASTPSPGVPHAYPAGLSAREVEVLRLVVGGLTNVQIARELVLSEKTVATHLTDIFNKTTSENRTAVTAFVIHHGLAWLLPSPRCGLPCDGLGHSSDTSHPAVTLLVGSSGVLRIPTRPCQIKNPRIFRKFFRCQGWL